MKNILLRLIAVALFCSCTNTRSVQQDKWLQYGKIEKATDPFLKELQQNNELVLAFAIETYAWAKTVNYNVLAMNKGEWKGYTWYVSRSQGADVVPNVNPSIVSNDSCNAVWKYFTEQEVWKIKGDDGGSFCTGEKANNCTINDGVTWRLLILTKDRIIAPAYYEPEFYEGCCPGNTERALFTVAVHKMRTAITISR